MTKEEFLKAIMELPKVATNNPISAMNGINVDDLMNAIDRLNKFPDYNDLIKENKQQKDVINKINNYISNYDVFKVFSFPLMKRWEEEQVKSSIDYEFKTSLIKDLKDILKEVSD